MKWLKILSVVAVVLAAVLCLVPDVNAQCVNGQCSRLGPPVVAAPGPFLGGPIVLQPASYVVYSEPIPIHEPAPAPVYRCAQAVPCVPSQQFHRCGSQRGIGIGFGVGIAWNRGRQCHSGYH